MKSWTILHSLQIYLTSGGGGIIFEGGEWFLKKIYTHSTDFPEVTNCRPNRNKSNYMAFSTVPSCPVSSNQNLVDGGLIRTVLALNRTVSFIPTDPLTTVYYKSNMI